MSDRNALEDALLKIESAARVAIDAAHDDDTPMSYSVVAALHNLHIALAALDTLRAEIRERIA